MWEKWVFIATAAGINCLMRAPAGDIVAAGAADLAEELLEECAAIATAEGFTPGKPTMDRTRGLFASASSGLAASMFRDIERGAPIEADHIIGDLLRRGAERSINNPLLRIVFAHLKTYEARRARETATGA
jgi:2-dehydropantoate 2-reductase